MSVEASIEKYKADKRADKGGIVRAAGVGMGSLSASVGLFSNEVKTGCMDVYDVMNAMAGDAAAESKEVQTAPIKGFEAFEYQPLGESPPSRGVWGQQGVKS